MGTIAISIIVLGCAGAVAATVLYVVAKKFQVHEDPRIAEIEALLPGANCGGCGASGCHAFAVECAKAKSLDGLVCPSSGEAVMKKIAGIVGLAPVAMTPKVAVLRCNGTCALRPHVNEYDGVKSCAIEASFYAGETACSYGCLGCGDCVATCPYDAIHMDEETKLPVVDYAKCVGCGRCVKACPRVLIELVENTGNKPLVVVACRNKDKGAVAMKECQVSCIGCGKCKKVCPAEAITVADFVAYIDPQKCTGCEECIEPCPRHSILNVYTPEKLRQKGGEKS